MKRSYTYLKGLLTLALAAFTGWMWAADPVATWTDFNTLTSGNYTITKDAACTVNTDGSITLGGAGLSVALAAGQEIYDGNTITVVMDVSGVTNEGALVGFTTANEPIDLYYTGAKLRQRWATDEKKDSNYGNVDWTPARATIVFAYDGRGSTGTTTYVDGTQKMNTAGLRFTGSGSVMSSLTFPATTGMTIHSIRLYSSKLSATDVYAVSYRSVISYCVNNNTSNDELSGLAIGEDAVTRVKNKHWNNISCSASGGDETANSYSLTSAQDNNGKLWPIEVSGTASGQWWYDDTASLGAKGNKYADGPWVMNFKDIPFTKYDVVLYMATDNDGQKWGAIQVGETNPTYYVPNSTDPTIATSESVTAETQWGQSKSGTAYGTNVIRITDLTDRDLYLKTLKNTRGGLHGFQIINRGEIRKIKADAGTTLTYTENTEITLEVNGTGTLLADGCTLDVTKATMKGCALAAQNNGVIVLKADQLDTIGGLTIPQGATVKIVTDSTEAVILGKATFAVPTNTTIAGSVTLVTLDGEKVATAEIADGILTAKFTANPAVTGSTWWWDYEFTGNATSIGSDKGGMTLEKTAWTQYTEANSEGNQALYFQQTPWRDAAFTSQDAFTAVMYCQPGEYNEVPLVGFGSTIAGGANAVAIVLATGKNAANGEMAILLVKGSGHVVTSLADNLIVPNATTTNHLYAFTFEAQADKTVISVYVDGKLKKTTTVNERFHVTNGFQIGSIHGGVMNQQTGLKKYTDGATEELAGTIDFLRVAKGVLSVDAMKALAKKYPYVSENGIAQRTIAGATATWVADAAWTQKGTGADVPQAAPNAGTNVALTIDAETEVTVNLDSDTTYETMTVDGTEAVTFKKGESKILAGDLTISTDTAIEYGAIEVGTVAIDAGKTLTFDFTEYNFNAIYASKTIALTGLVTLADDTAKVEADLPELPGYMKADVVLDSAKGEYALAITVIGELTATISGSGNWDSITWKVGDVVIAQPNLEVLETIPLIASADATLSMNKAVTVKNLVISGEGALIIAENGGNKLTVSGATTINANVTATAGAAALGSITITDDNSLAIKEKIANVGTIASNAGELVYMGGDITEDKQLTNVIGAIHIASGTVNFTKANGDYTTGAITIDNGATMKVSEGQHNSFGNSPITNNGAIVSAGSGAHLYPVVSGTGTLTVESGTLTLHGANTYQGGTTVAGGTLVVSGTDAAAKVLPEGKTVTVNADATIQLVAGLSFVTIEGEGKTLVTGTYTYGIAGANGVASDLTTKTVEVAEGGVLQFRAWRAYALTIDTLIVNGTVKSEGYDGSVVPTVTVAQGQKLSGTGTIELAVTLADGALVGNVAVVPAAAVVQGSVTCDTAEIATALAEKLTPPTGYRFNVTDKVLSIALNKVTVTLPAIQNAVWKDAEGNTIPSIELDPNSSTSVKLETTGDYVFADGSTSMDVTITSGESDSEAEMPADASIVAAGAKIGDKLYTSFAAAFAAAKADDTITLLAGVTINSRLDIAMNVTIDLNGQTVAETMEDQFGAIYVKKGAKLTIEATNGGEITTDGGIVIGNYGTVIVNGGTIAAGDDAEADVSIYNFYYQADWYGTTTINGGTVARIWNCGVATLAGGTITDVDNSGAMEIAEEATVTNVLLRDGTDAPGIEGAGTLKAAEDLTVTTEEGYTAVYDAETGTWTAIDPSIGKAAKIGDEYYDTFLGENGALAAAKAGDTITLLADVTVDGVSNRVVIDKAITLDGNGRKITATNTTADCRAININCDGTVKIQNLTVVAAGERAINVIQKPVELTIDEVTLTAHNYAVNVAGTAGAAKITITNSTLNGLNIVNVAAVGAQVVVEDSTLNLNDNLTEPSNSFAALCLNKDATNASIAANRCTFNITSDENSPSVMAKNGGAEGGTITINGSSDDVGNAVALVLTPGSNYYLGCATLEEAIQAAKAGQIIQLCANVEASEIITIAKAITLDGNGKTLTSTAGRAINVDCAGAVTIKNLTINANGERAINIIEKPAKVTINGVTATAANNAVMIATTAGAAEVSIDGCNLTGLSVVGVYGAGADVTIANSTIANVDANKNENYGAITVGDTAIGATVDVDDVTNTKITVMDDSKKAYNFAPSATITGVDEVGVVVAMIGEAGYDTIEEAAKDVKAGQTIVLVTDVETDEVLSIAGTLDLNGKTSKGTILGKIAVNGGTYITAENVPVIGKNARAFETTNAVFTMDAVAGNITLNAGTVTAKGWDNGNNWTVPGQALVVKSGVTLTVPAEVTMQVNGTSITIEDGATLNIAGKINLYSADATIKAPANLNVTTSVAGCEVKYVEGVYTVVESIVVPPAIAEDENIPAETKEAIKEAMEAAGVTEITGYTVKTADKTEATVADVAAVLEVFDVEPAVEDGKLVVAYEFGISAMTNVGDTITITAGVDENTEIRAGVAVVFYADDVKLGAVSSRDGKTASITADAKAINGKKITVEASNEVSFE